MSPAISAGIGFLLLGQSSPLGQLAGTMLLAAAGVGTMPKADEDDPAGGSG